MTTQPSHEPQAHSLLAGHHMDLSHQELDRLFQALEQLYNDAKASTPQLEWMPTTGVAALLAQELGYEDTDEFEDALGCTFLQFLQTLPTFEVKQDDRFTGGFVFKVLPDPPRESWRPTLLEVTIRESRDLWRVCHKSPHGHIVLPHIEFEISGDGQRVIDTLYNHISRAVFNLNTRVGPAGGGSAMSGEMKAKILETTAQLSALLDVEEPFKICIYDPSGVSEIKPNEDVTVSTYDPSSEDTPYR